MGQLRYYLHGLQITILTTFKGLLLEENMHFRTLSILASLIATVGCSTPTTPRALGVDDLNQATTQVPAYLTAKPSCAVVVGGVGSVFDDPRVGSVWHEANRQITGYLHEILTHEGYKVVQLVVPPNESLDKTVRLTAESLAQDQCNRMIQVSHLVFSTNRIGASRASVRVCTTSCTGRFGNGHSCIPTNRAMASC